MLDDASLILKRRFWAELVRPGGRYYLAPAPAAPAPAANMGPVGRRDGVEAAGAAATAEGRRERSQSEAGSLERRIAAAPKKRPAVGTLVRVTVRASEDCGRIVECRTFPRSSPLGDVIEELGGVGAKIQILRRVADGYLPGLTYMSGTRKTLAELKWTGNVQVCVFHAEDM